MRVGIGVDVHRFSDDPQREMYLACLQWQGVVGCEGHSDSDVAAHAVCDAVLSAAGLGDLGHVIGTDDPQWKNASGAKLLAYISEQVRGSGYEIVNAAVQIIGNAPRIGTRRHEAELAMSSALGAPVSVAATTADGLGLTGRGEGLAAIATALVATLNQ